MNYGKEENQMWVFFMHWVKIFGPNNGKDNLEKFNSKLDKTIFLGYSTTSILNF